MSAKSKRKPIYTLNIFHSYNEKIRSNVVVFLVQTVRIFVNFRYEILLENEVTSKSIKIKILGLHIPELLFPGTGPAKGLLEYKDLFGEYDLTIIKQDKTANEFKLNITTNKISIEQKTNRPFIIVSNEPVNIS